MKKCKLYYLAAGIFLGLFLLISGCSENNREIEKVVESNPESKLALTFKTGQNNSYRLKTLSQRKVSVEGPVRENSMSFQGGQTTDKIEMVFDSAIQNVNSAGNAIEKITIKELKYFSEVRDKPVIEFDSLKDKDPNNALLALIGQSYTIEITPSGQVVKISDADKVLTDIKDFPSNNEAATRLLSDSDIKLRHSVPLPDSNDNELKEGKTWSNVASFDFGLMGSGSYERTFKLDEIKKANGNLDALIEMSAIPSVEGVGDSGAGRGSPAAPPMTDIRQKYSGSIELNVTTGTLLKYEENLVNEWLVVPPGSSLQGTPSVLNMTATRSYDLEKIK